MTTATTRFRNVTGYDPQFSNFLCQITKDKTWYHFKSLFHKAAEKNDFVSINNIRDIHIYILVLIYNYALHTYANYFVEIFIYIKIYKRVNT